MKTIRRGSISVAIYRAGKGKGREIRYKLLLETPSKENPKGSWTWVRKTFPTQKSAELAAEEIAIGLNNGAIIAGQLTPTQANAYRRLEDIAERTGTTLERIGLEHELAWEKSQKLIGAGGAKVPELIEKFLAAKKSKGIGDYYTRDLQNRLAAFAEHFQRNALNEIRADDITAWLDARQMAPRTWNNYLAAIKSFTSWCKKHELIDPKFSGDRIDPNRIPWKRPEIYSPAEIRSLLLAAAPTLRRCIALSAFAGLRTEEVAGIRWEDFKWDQRFIHVDETVAKTRQHAPPILETLRPWIGTIEQTGKFSPYKDAHSLSQVKEALRRRLKLPNRRNGLRKSWISYRLALTQNEVLVADEAGTSLSDLRKNYLNRPSLIEAQKYFGIRPDYIPQNITQLALAVI